MIEKPTPREPVVGSPHTWPPTVRDIEQVIHGMVRSDEPAVVLSSLARSSNPLFSDACAIELSKGTEGLFQVSFPLPEEAAWTCSAAPVGADKRTVAGKTVTTGFQVASCHGCPSFAGVVEHTWIGRDPTEDDAVIARLLVDYALAVVQQERLAALAARADSRAAKLAIEIITSRAEGKAIGILMTTHQITSADAVSLLRRTSHASGRELRDVVADVVRTGDLRPLPENNIGRPARRGHLHTATSSRP